MKRRVLALIMAMVMVLSLVACGGTEQGGDDTKKTIKVGMVTDVGGINDKSFNQTSWEGLQRAEKELGVEITYMESHTDADYSTTIEALVDAECDIIISVGYMLATATREAATSVIGRPSNDFGGFAYSRVLLTPVKRTIAIRKPIPAPAEATIDSTKE